MRQQPGTAKPTADISANAAMVVSGLIAASAHSARNDSGTTDPAWREASRVRDDAVPSVRRVVRPSIRVWAIQFSLPKRLRRPRAGSSSFHVMKSVRAVSASGAGRGGRFWAAAVCGRAMLVTPAFRQDEIHAVPGKRSGQGGKRFAIRLRELSCPVGIHANRLRRRADPGFLPRGVTLPRGGVFGHT